MRKKLIALIIISALLSGGAFAQGDRRGDVFKGKLFPPNIILEHQDELGLSKEQFTAIRAAVVAVQANIAEHEWDVREAYQRIMAGLDETPIDEKRVLRDVEAALLAENEVKKKQVAMLIRLKNTLTDGQIEYLESVSRK